MDGSATVGGLAYTPALQFLAVQIELGRMLGMGGKPTEKQLRELAEAWRPHRGAAAIFTWHIYAKGFQAI